MKKHSGNDGRTTNQMKPISIARRTTAPKVSKSDKSLGETRRDIETKHEQQALAKQLDSFYE